MFQMVYLRVVKRTEFNRRFLAPRVVFCLVQFEVNAVLVGPPKCANPGLLSGCYSSVDS